MRYFLRRKPKGRFLYVETACDLPIFSSFADGAGPLARIRAVTLPAMVPVIAFSLIMAMGNILNNDFEQILLYYNAAVYDEWAGKR